MEAAVNRDRQYLGNRHGMTASAISLARLGRYKDAYKAVDTLKKNNPKVSQGETQSIVNDIRTLEQAGGARKN
jgi:hypothetical protein